MRTILVAALVAMATPAMATGLGDILKPKPKTTSPGPGPSPQPGVNTPPPMGRGTPAVISSQADSAKASVDVAEVELQASKLYLSGLSDMSSKPSTWDRPHSVILFNQAQRTVIRAEEQLAELEKIATGNAGWAAATDPIRRARTDLVETEHQLRSFAAQVNGGQFQQQDAQQLQTLWQSVDKAQKDMESAAGTMGVDYHLKGVLKGF